jgi:hypothetical protein
LTTNSHPEGADTRAEVREALSDWPASRSRLLELARSDDQEQLHDVGHALARCGRGRREAADEFLDLYESDRRLSVRTAVHFARVRLAEDDPREFVREMNRIASLPGPKPWVIMMEEIYRMWSRAPREMYRLMTPWLTHRDPWRRWAALHGLEVPARKNPRSALKVLRLLRGERHLRVRRLLGHVLGQSLYPYHPDEALEEMAQWMVDGAPVATSVVRQNERQVFTWFEAGFGSYRQKRSLLRVARDYLDHDDPDVRSHARRLVRGLNSE